MPSKKEGGQNQLGIGPKDGDSQTLGLARAGEKWKERTDKYFFEIVKEFYSTIPGAIIAFRKK